MKTDSIKSPADAAEGTLFLGDDWFDPLETGGTSRFVRQTALTQTKHEH